MVFFAVQNRADRMPWYCVIGCMVSSASLAVAVCQMPADGLVVHAASLILSMGILSFVESYEKNFR